MKNRNFPLPTGVEVLRIQQVFTALQGEARRSKAKQGEARRSKAKQSEAREIFNGIILI